MDPKTYKNKLMKNKKQHLIDIMKSDEALGLYDYGWCKGNVILPQEEPKQSIKDKILSETPESVIQKVRETTNELVEQNIISDWLEKNRNPEIDKQVEMEAKQLSKQETFEEAGVAYAKTVKQNHTSHMLGFLNGAKWQSERMYSEEEALRMLDLFRVYFMLDIKKEDVVKWFEQFKKK